MKPPRTKTLTTRVRPAIERRIREAARDDMRTVSAYLAVLLENVLAEKAERADG